MSKRFGIVPVLLSAVVALAAVPAPASAAAGAAGAPGSPLAPPFAARGFGRRSPSFGPRYRGTRSPYTRSYRRSPFSGFGGTMLKWLGISYLFHMLFGIGAGGGSPFGLLILVALIAFFVGRMRS